MFAGIIAVENRIGYLDGELSVPFHGIARVDREIEDGRLELRWIGLGPPQAAAEHGLDLHGLTQRPAKQFGHARHQPVGVDRLDLQRLLP